MAANAGELLGLRLWQVGRETTFFPQTAGLEKLDAFTALQDTALGADGTAGIFEAAMLRHVLGWCLGLEN